MTSNDSPPAPNPDRRLRIEPPLAVDPTPAPRRQRLVVDQNPQNQLAAFILNLRHDYEVEIVADRAAILSDPTVNSVYAIIISQTPSRMTVREFCDRLRRTVFNPPKLIAVGNRASPWLTFVEQQSNVDGVICLEDPLERQIQVLSQLVSQDVDRRMMSLGDRAAAIWVKAKDLVQNIAVLARSGQPIPQSVVHSFAEMVVDDPDDGLFMDIIAALRDHHSETLIHCLDMAITALLLGRHVGVRSKADHHRLFEAGLMHDIGKTTVPVAILDKPGRLDSDEMAVIRTHPLASERILRDSGGYDELVVRAALQHHERNDGTGYPYALASTQISEIGRLMAVCDVYCALTERRAYKPRLTPNETFRILRQSVGSHLDGVLVERLIEMVTGHLGPRIHEL